MFENIRHGLESSRTAGGEQRPKGTQSGSSSWSGRNQGAAAEADAIGEQLNRMQSRAAAEADANGEQQLKRIEAIARGATAEADTVGEQQLCTESCPAPDFSHRN